MKKNTEQKPMVCFELGYPSFFVETPEGLEALLQERVDNYCLAAVRAKKQLLISDKKWTSEWGLPLTCRPPRSVVARQRRAVAGFGPKVQELLEIPREENFWSTMNALASVDSAPLALGAFWLDLFTEVESGYLLDKASMLMFALDLHLRGSPKMIARLPKAERYCKYLPVLLTQWRAGGGKQNIREAEKHTHSVGPNALADHWRKYEAGFLPKTSQYIRRMTATGERAKSAREQR